MITIKPQKHAQQKEIRSHIPSWSPRTSNLEISIRFQSRTPPTVIHRGLIRPFPIWYGATAFFASSLPIILRKNRLYHYLYAFETSTNITLKIFPQINSPHTNQIICSIHEQPDFRTSISCFPFSSSLPFYFLSPFFLSLSQIFSLFFSSFSRLSITQIFYGT